MKGKFNLTVEVYMYAFTKITSKITSQPEQKVC